MSKTTNDLSGIRGTSCAIGVFDGFHVGHSMIIEKAIEHAKGIGIESSVLTFDKDPDDLLSSSHHKLSTDLQRIGRLAESGVDRVCVLEFTSDIASLSPSAFCDCFLLENPPIAIHVGDDFRFGKGAEGDVSYLRNWAESNGIEVYSYDLLQRGGTEVHSSAIRRLLGEGGIESANELLGRPYSITERVVKGRGEGTHMGFSTANMNVPEDLRILENGVYGGYVSIDGVRYKAAISLGVSPTFSNRAKSNLEVHVLGYEGDLYGKELTVEFMIRLAPLIKFDDVEDLKAAVGGYIDKINEVL